VGNPLLANLGQQGREFLALLQDYSTVNVELFVKAGHEKNDVDNMLSAESSNSVLHQIQNDILALNDATAAPQQSIDNSITITSCHSALREVQALHDFLLHQFNDSEINTENNIDKLTPKDVLVMCPQIEQYAPYVNAVFTRGWQELDDEMPPLPCSIADRSAKDSDPLIAAFSELLTLPDSRFQVSQLLSFIRLPAVAFKFSINEEDSEKIALWLEQATVHWGRDQAHKQQVALLSKTMKEVKSKAKANIEEVKTKTKAYIKVLKSKVQLAVEKGDKRLAHSHCVSTNLHSKLKVSY
jgi:exodeoxyribonuclease V gamma subunit